MHPHTLQNHKNDFKFCLLNRTTVFKFQTYGTQQIEFHYCITCIALQDIFMHFVINLLWPKYTAQVFPSSNNAHRILLTFFISLCVTRYRRLSSCMYYFIPCVQKFPFCNAYYDFSTFMEATKMIFPISLFTEWFGQVTGPIKCHQWTICISM